MDGVYGHICLARSGGLLEATTEEATAAAWFGSNRAGVNLSGFKGVGGVLSPKPPLKPGCKPTNWLDNKARAPARRAS